MVFRNVEMSFAVSGTSGDLRCMILPSSTGISFFVPRPRGGKCRPDGWRRAIDPQLARPPAEGRVGSILYWKNAGLFHVAHDIDLANLGNSNLLSPTSFTLRSGRPHRSGRAPECGGECDWLSIRPGLRVADENLAAGIFSQPLRPGRASRSVSGHQPEDHRHLDGSRNADRAAVVLSDRTVT